MSNIMNHIANPDTKLGRVIQKAVLVATGAVALSACSNTTATPPPAESVTAPATTGTATEQPTQNDTSTQDMPATSQQPTGANTDSTQYAINDPNNPAYSGCQLLQDRLSLLNDIIANGGTGFGYDGTPIVKVTKVIYPDTKPADVALGHEWDVVYQMSDGSYDGSGDKC